MADAMKLVPVEPTEAMLSAVARLDWFSTSDVSWADGYRAMLAASPPAREEAPGEGAGDDDWAIDYHATVGVSAYLQRQGLLDSAKAVERMLSRAASYHNCREAHMELASLRNRTSEPEAGAVAYCNTEHLTRIKREAQAQGEASSVMFVYPCGAYRTPLYLHPAPATATADKMRELVEDIKSAADSFRDCDGDEVAHQVIIRCDQAIAALTEEGRS